MTWEKIIAVLLVTQISTCVADIKLKSSADKIISSMLCQELNARGRGLGSNWQHGTHLT